jgi:hypothetical protein
MSNKKEIDRRQALGMLAVTGSAATGLLGYGSEVSEAGESVAEISQAVSSPETHLEEPLTPRGVQADGGVPLLPGTYTYAEKTLRAGDTLHLCVSSDTSKTPAPRRRRTRTKT